MYLEHRHHVTTELDEDARSQNTTLNKREKTMESKTTEGSLLIGWWMTRYHRQ